MRQSIGAVGRNVNLDEPVTLQVIIFCCRHAHRCVFRQHDDAGMVTSHAYFILGTDHSTRLHTAELRFLDDKFLVAVIEHAAQVCHDNLLSGSHIGRTTDNLRRSLATEVNGCNMKMVRIGVHLACKHLAYIKSFESTLDALYFFECIDFESA